MLQRSIGMRRAAVQLRLRLSCPVAAPLSRGPGIAQAEATGRRLQELPKKKP